MLLYWYCYQVTFLTFHAGLRIWRTLLYQEMEVVSYYSRLNRAYI